MVGTITPSHTKHTPTPSRDNLKEAQAIALQGIKNQNYRFKIITENMTNSDSVSMVPGGDPYRRQQVAFQPKVDARAGVTTLQVQGLIPDQTEFPKEYNPGHPGADADGFVKKPNVDRVVETVDMINVQNIQKALNNVHRETTTVRRMNIDLMR
ncbi:MAG: flagellar basal body rod protein FlgC [Alphaproteobacteria bacterium]|nr:flagellar basal body rod protein FlgC [Alphaproteobacteria bacterium]